MKPSTRSRRAVFACLLASCAAVSTTGCTSGGMSLASMNPFSQRDASLSADQTGLAAGTNEVIASTTGRTKSAFQTVGNTTKGAFTKTGSTIAGMFGRVKTTVDGKTVAEDDELSLANMPTSVASEVRVANGKLWESSGNLPKAMESYQMALETDPTDGAALASVARLHFRDGRYSEASASFQKAILQSPEDAALYNDLGLTLSRLGQHQSAVQTLQQAQTLAPGTSRYANNLASVQFESGDQTSAFTTLSTGNKPAVAHFNMAYLHYRKGQVDAAKGQLNQAVAYEPQGVADTAIKRAVDRSREMLAQIDGPTAPDQPAPNAQPAPTVPGTAGPQVRIAQASTAPTRSIPAQPQATTTQTQPISVSFSSDSPVPVLPASATSTVTAPVAAPAAPNSWVPQPTTPQPATTGGFTMPPAANN